MSLNVTTWHPREGKNGAINDNCRRAGGWRAELPPSLGELLLLLLGELGGSGHRTQPSSELELDEEWDRSLCSC